MNVSGGIYVVCKLLKCVRCKCESDSSTISVNGGWRVGFSTGWHKTHIRYNRDSNVFNVVDNVRVRICRECSSRQTCACIRGIPVSPVRRACIGRINLSRANRKTARPNFKCVCTSSKLYVNWYGIPIGSSRSNNAWTEFRASVNRLLSVRTSARRREDQYSKLLIASYTASRHCVQPKSVYPRTRTKRKYVANDVTITKRSSNVYWPCIALSLELLVRCRNRRFSTNPSTTGSRSTWVYPACAAVNHTSLTVGVADCRNGG